MSNHDTTSVIVRSELDTEELGMCLARVLEPGMVVALHGDLGAGKTVLTRGIARGLGIAEPVTSPTFTFVQEYECMEGLWLFHIDMYRIDRETEALSTGLEDYLFTPDGVTVIEWAERVGALIQAELPWHGEDRLVEIHVEHVSVTERRITLPARILSCPGSSDA